VAIAEHIRDKIEKVDAGRFRVDRSVIDDVLATPTASLGRARVVRSLRGGQEASMRLYGVEPGGLLDYLGLRTGDRLEAVNDWVLSNPEMALRAYAATRTASAVSIRLSRDGRQHLIQLELY
jgi:type II secretory pathway component PulC